jgi:predicted acyl esterase
VEARAAARRLRAGLWGLAGAALCVAIAAAPAAAITKSSYRVPVTAPDEFGAPVTIEADVYLPDGDPPGSGWPLVQVLHGGGANKDNAYDGGHAEGLAEAGYAAIVYSQRGHGDSTGQLSVAGPKEIRDLFDVTAWALGIAGFGPPHPDFRLDAGRIALMGNSQGGLNTNMGQAWSGDPQINPYGIRIRAVLPQDTPDVVFDALVPNQVVKLSFGVGLVGTYTFTGDTQARMAPSVLRWVSTAAIDQPSLYGGEVCDYAGHDTPTSTMKQDLAARSVGCLADRYTVPFLWTQAIDDGLFPGDMGISMWRHAPAETKRLYLSMGGHGSPFPHPSNEQDEFEAHLEFLDHVMYGESLRMPAVTYWTRDPRVQVPADEYRYPRDAWFRQTADDWPPPVTEDVTYRLGADGRAVAEGPAEEGELPLGATAPDPAGDPVIATVFSATPLGTSPLASLSPGSTGAPGVVASFATEPFGSDQELSGNAVARLAWTPASPDSQLVLKVVDMAPDGTLTLLSRGVQGIRGATPGEPLTVTVRSDSLSSLIPEGHRVVIWVTGGDASFYKAYPGSVGGSLAAGEASTVTLPLRRGGPGGGRPCGIQLLGTRGSDRVKGTDGGERINVRAGADRVGARGGSDCVKGRRGADRLRGQEGRDELAGGRGRDTLKARGGGRDTVRCGRGRDRAVVGRRDRVRGCEKVRRGR